MLNAHTCILSILSALLLMGTGCQSLSPQHDIRLEHVAFNVEDPVALADWYVTNLDMVITVKGDAPGYARYVADAGKNMILEFYHNTDVMIPDYPSIDWHVFHIAFAVQDIEVVRERLIKAGATPDTDITTSDNGDRMTMLRDPWGLPLQFFQRVEPKL